MPAHGTHSIWGPPDRGLGGRYRAFPESISGPIKSFRPDAVLDDLVLPQRFYLCCAESKFRKHLFGLLAERRRPRRHFARRS
jgi:hypothetical protein